MTSVSFYVAFVYTLCITFFFLSESDDVDAVVRSLLWKSPIGVILGQICDEQHDMADLVELYLTDFVQMIHRPRSSNSEMEFKVNIYLFYL